MREVEEAEEAGFRGTRRRTRLRPAGYGRQVSRSAVRAIEAIVNRMNRGMTRTYPQLISEVLRATGGVGEQRTRIVDLYLRNGRGNELFFEMKSPKPN